MKFNLAVATLAAAVAAQTDVDPQFEDPKLQAALSVLAPSPFKLADKNEALLKNGNIGAKKPRPFRFPERKPKMTLKQITRPNVHVSPTYIVPPPVYQHPLTYGYPVASYDPYSPVATYTHEYVPPMYPGYPLSGVPPSHIVTKAKSKTEDEQGRPVYPEWAQDILGKYREHDLIVHPLAHPLQPSMRIKPKQPSFTDFLNDEYYDKLKTAADKARYHYAFDACQRKGKSWSAKKRYRCFRLMWKQYKPHKSNSLNAVRDRVQRDCQKYANHPELRKKCFEEHIKNYEDRLVGKSKEIASGLAEADNNEMDENNTDYEKVI